MGADIDNDNLCGTRQKEVEMIPFIQYVMSDGRGFEIGINVPEEIETKAGYILDAGYRFEMEVFSIGRIYMTCTKDGPDVLSTQSCPIGPLVVDAVASLVTTAYQRLQERHD